VAIRLCDHHLAHAASTYYASGFDEALVLTFDFSGDRRSTTVSVGRDGRLEPRAEMRKPNSLGIYYSAVTQYLGFQRDSDEYKVMGMAAYGRDVYDFSPVLAETADGYRFHHEFIRGVTPDQPSPGKQEPLFDRFPLPVPPRHPGAPVEPVHYDLAASAQAQLERAVLSLVRHHVAATGVRKVCLAGGVALNCLMVQKIRESGLVDAVFVPPVASDAGLALGGAYLSAVESGHTLQPLTHAYWGPSFSDAEIRDVLDRVHARYREVDDPAETAARHIAHGKLVGWFQGRMEFGPRALGNRSILALPRDAAVKDRLNAEVKFREEFRPFAPSVRHADGPHYFTRYADSPFMTQTFSAAPPTVAAAPAVVHADGTSRLQSVHAASNPVYDALITAVGRRTDTPLVLNTSLNSLGDPIACDPYGALRTFFASGLDALVIGRFLLEKG
jgi:carbamoyltransferase